MAKPFVIGFARSVLMLTALWLSACVSTPPTARMPDITIEEPDRMRFYGKGAGAGMMMMGSMGPMGIAIGVAIDEGIGKDIGEAAGNAGFSIVGTLREALHEAKGVDAIQRIHIERYGFVVHAGEGEDPVAPQLHVTVTMASGDVMSLRYPEGVEGQEIPTMPLAEAKVDGESVKRLHAVAARALIARLLAPRTNTEAK